MVKRAAQAIPNHLLRRARKERGWTQQQLADLIEAPLSLNITRWERGTAIPSAYYSQKLCKIFGQSAEELGLVVPGERAGQPISSTRNTFWNVPYQRNLFFTGREQLLIQLEQKLLKQPRSTPMPLLALCGLGGIGKTQLAVEYAYRHFQQYLAVFWVNAASYETLCADFRALARLLSLPQDETQDQAEVVDAVLSWLTQNQRWLLILDNADDLIIVQDFLPRTGQGHVLLTTRAQATGILATRIEVEKMESQESVLLLLRRSKWLPLDAPLSSLDISTLDEAHALACALDGLPLALSQAAAYLEECGCRLQEYLDLYEKHHGSPSGGGDRR
jgi:transcriptional regulator with XRE-family HTH domain